jgi:hypothetical protein
VVLFGLQGQCDLQFRTTGVHHRSRTDMVASLCFQHYVKREDFDPPCHLCVFVSLIFLYVE